MTNESTQVSSCIVNPVSLADAYPWQFQGETPDIVKDYFNAVGIMDVLSEDNFEQSLLQHYGLDATEYLNALKGENSWGKPAESIRAGNLELALAVRSQLDGTRYEAIFSWLASANLLQPKRVLDIGCGIGISSCFYATLFPQATITGIDESADAVACAKKLAAKLQLKNVEFVQADILGLPSDLKDQKFDLVFATHLSAEMSDDLPYYGDTIEDVLAWQRPSESTTPRAQPLADLLADDKSTLVSCEDISTPHDLAEWLRSLRDVGVYVPWEKVDLVDYLNTKYDYCDRLLLMIGSKHPADLPAAEDIRSLWTGGIDQIPEQDVYEGIEAESVLAATEPKECHAEIVTEIRGLDLICYELWETPGEVLIYKHGDFGTKLVRLPAESPKRLTELLVEAFDDEEDDPEDA